MVGQESQTRRGWGGAHLDKGVVLFVAQVNRDDGLVALESESLQVLREVTVREQVVLCHLGVEELTDTLLGRVHADIADVQATRLAGLGADGGAGADGAKDGRAVKHGLVLAEFDAGRQVRLGLTREVEHACVGGDRQSGPGQGMSGLPKGEY